MGVFSGKKYRKCVQDSQTGDVDCISYHPTKDGKKVVTATIKAQMNQNCEIAISDSDGDPGDIEDLEKHLSQRANLRCKKPSEL